MTEQTTHAIESDEDLFDPNEIDESDMIDDNDDDDEDGDEGLEDVDPARSDKQPPKTDSKLKIKYNGQEEEYDLATQIEEVKTLAQKGRNYDHVKGELDALKGSEELTFLKNLAEEAGFTDVKEYVSTLKKDIQQKQVQTRVKELQADGMTREQAEYTANLEMQARAPKPLTPPQADPTADLKTGFETLFKEYPETAKMKSLADFPPEVVKAIEEGATPIVAYQKHLLNESTKKAEKDNHNAKVKQRDIGSLQSGKADEEEDQFLRELFK